LSGLQTCAQESVSGVVLAPSSLNQSQLVLARTDSNCAGTGTVGEALRDIYSSVKRANKSLDLDYRSA